MSALIAEIKETRKLLEELRNSIEGINFDIEDIKNILCARTSFGQYSIFVHPGDKND